MRILRRIWHDIRHGENIDVYLTIIIALFIAVLNLTGIVTPGPALINSITLALLGLLAVSNLKNRYLMEELSVQSLPSADKIFLENLPQPEFRDDFETADELWLIGVTLTTTIRRGHSTIEQKLRKGHRIKVLVVRPEGPAVTMAHRRSSSSPERTRTEILNVLEDLCQLREIAPDKLKIRTIRYPLSYSAIAINPDTILGTLYIQHYPFKVSGGSKPKFILRAKDGRWYELFKEELENLWNNGVDWTCTTNSL